METGTGGIFDAYKPAPTYDWSQSQTQAGDYNDPYNLFLSTIPIIKGTMESNIRSGLESTGLTGSRYSRDALRVGAQEGRQGASEMNALLTSLLYNQTNADLDRQITAATTLGNWTPYVEDALKSRLGFQSGLAQTEQQRYDKANADALARESAARNDWWKRTTWPLQFLGSMANNSIGSPPQPIVTTKGGSSGVGDDLLDIATIWAAWG